MMTLLKCLLAMSLLALSYAQDGYCSLCKYHTMCGTTNKGAKCQSDYRSIPVGAADIKEILDVHNAERNRVALGKETASPDGAMPPAANMMKVEWDPELATMAQRMTDQCVYGHDCDACRSSIGKRFQVGQNAAAGYASYGKAVTGWIGEVKAFPHSYVKKFVFDVNAPEEKVIGHFSQVIWWNARLVGCGMTYNAGYHVTACNYGGGGNLPGDMVYVAGSAASQCPAGTAKDSAYPGLCAIQTKPVDGKFPTDNKFLNFPNSFPGDPPCYATSFRV